MASTDASPTDRPPFRQVKARRQFEEIVDQVRALIESGELVPGDRLPAEREMASMFGVSRQGVREALRALEIAGLVQSKTGTAGGAFIRPGGPATVTQAFHDLTSLGTFSWEDLLEARILVMADVLRLATERATEADFAELEADTTRVERFNVIGHTRKRAAALTNFYRLVARAAHNEVLAMLAESLADLFQARLAKVGAKPRSDVVEVRRSVIAAMRSGDADAAVETLTAHMRRLERYLLDQSEA